jgi:hypothetical protein
MKLLADNEEETVGNSCYQWVFLALFLALIDGGIMEKRISSTECPA